MAIDTAMLRASRRSWLDASEPRVGPWWLQWVWTLLFCAAMAAGFTVLGFLAFARDSEGAWRNLAGWAQWYGRNFVVTLTIGALIHIVFDLLLRTPSRREHVRRWRPWQRTLFFSGVPLLCVVVGWPLGVWLAGAGMHKWVTSLYGSNVLVGSLLLSLCLTVVFHHYFGVKAQQYAAEKRAAEAQLRLLQAQMEPHFLFNTLANVISLIDHDAPRAKAMLESFTDYLRSSLASLRVDDATVGSELALARSYLELLQTRMEDRLRFSIAADDAALRAHVAPLLLQPLVENAVHHGLEPKLEGGHVRVTARVQGGELVLQVSDDGLGLDAPPRRRTGAGVALANIRERLQARHGHAAGLTLAPAHPGTVATLRLPLETR